ncbi:MAG: ribonuclease III [Gammaproteobacteria bacterium]|nr:ribonuclease III [Gammaproteobacteria bacterium]
MKPEICQAISGYKFRQAELLDQALSHRSFSRNRNNERLEFLGDSVLSLVISQYIYQQLADADEGELSRVRASLVKEETLANIARKNNLGEYIHLGEGELKSGGFRRASILSDALEALIGAIYLDSNFEQAREAVLYLFRAYLDTLPDSQSLKDPKTRLQEFLQSKQSNLPDYEVVQTVGKAHDQVFTVKCRVSAFSVEASGKGRSRKKAEQVAAARAFEQLTS